jgi:cation-transporting P-type ATPase 13A2
MAETYLVATVVYLTNFGVLMSIDIEPSMMVFRYLDYITESVPAPYPIFFNLCYSFCLVRLHRDGILGVDCEKTVESGRMKTLCFDKTGTLTLHQLEISQIYHIQNQKDRVLLQKKS